MSKSVNRTSTASCTHQSCLPKHCSELHFFIIEGFFITRLTHNMFYKQCMQGIIYMQQENCTLQKYYGIILEFLKTVRPLHFYSLPVNLITPIISSLKFVPFLFITFLLCSYNLPFKMQFTISAKYTTKHT